MRNYLVATLGVGVAFAAHIIIHSFSDDSAGLWLLCSAAILFAAWVGGLRVGFYALGLTFVLCTGFLLHFSPGKWVLGPTQVLELTVFLFQGILISALCGDLRSTNERSLRYQRELEDALEEVQSARTEAEEANRAQHEFLANTSHELRTPVNAILGLTQFSLKAEELSEGIRDNLETVTDSARSLLRLLNDLLDYSKIEAGSFDLRPRRFTFHDVLERAVRTHSAAASSKGLELACMVTSDIPAELIGDPERFGQIVSNLTGNAVKFTSQGEVFVRAELVKETSRRVTIKVLVRDTGIGIPENQQRNIFHAFRQVDASNTRQKGGVGLGLAIVSEVSAQMGGEAGVVSQPGEGSTFFFTANLRKPKKSQERKTQTRNLLAMLHGLKVLVVDDSPTSREIVAEMLSNWAMNPVAVDDAEAAIEKLKDDKDIQLMIVDALMPETDGFELVEELQDDHERPTLLMLSAADRATFADRLKKLNLAGCIEKPISQSDLLDAIVQALRGEASDVVDATQIPESVSLTLRVLLVEDTPANQKVVTRVLQHRGHQVEIATNGREGIEMASQGDFDCILMDVQMPTMDGFQATAAIRELDDPEKSNTPIIAMTAHAMTGDREKCLAAGMDGYIAKPIDIDDLLEIVESFGSGTPPAQRARLTRNESDMKDTTGAAEAPIWDEASAMKRLQGNRELLDDLIGYFLEDSPGLITQLKTACAEGNANEAERAAHSLKGLARGFSASGAAAVASEAEDLSRENRLPEVAEILGLVEIHFQNLAKALQTSRS